MRRNQDWIRTLKLTTLSTSAISTTFSIAPKLETVNILSHGNVIRDKRKDWHLFQDKEKINACILQSPISFFCNLQSNDLYFHRI